MSLASSAEHLSAALAAVGALRGECARLEAWGERLARVLMDGGRLLAAGNGGSAAQAEHLTCELVGRYRTERPALSAIALHSDGSALSAVANDYGSEEGYARAVRAHGRPGDVLIALSTSGRSANVLAAAEAAAEMDLETWALTGPAPNPLTALCAEALAVDAATTATVQEAHLVALHLLCGAVEVRVTEAATLRPVARRALS